MIEIDSNRPSTPMPSLFGSQDSRTLLGKESKGMAQNSKDMDMDELAKKLLEKMNPSGQQPMQGNLHLYPQRDMVWCGICNGNHPSNECPRLHARPLASWCGHCNRWGHHETNQCRYPKVAPQQ